MTNNTQNPADSGAMPTTLIPLSSWGLIFVEGPDAATLLQGQLTNSILGLKRTLCGQIAVGNEAVRLVGYCNPKGRLLASAWLCLRPKDSESEDRFVLFISKDIAASTAKKLSMYILRSKVKVIDASNDWSVFGSLNESKVEVLTGAVDSALALQLPAVLDGEKSFNRALIAIPRSGESPTEIDCAQLLQRWNSLEVISAIPRIVQATQEQFVPQMINFESVAGVDFKKGCYPGQEIVARSQYRGAVKRRLQLAYTEVNEISLGLSIPGAELYHSSDSSQPCGMVVLAAQNPNHPNRIDLQVECKLEALEGGEIHLGNSKGPVLKIDLLPYPLIEI